MTGLGKSCQTSRDPASAAKRPGLPYLDGFKGIFAEKQATRIDALRSDRAAIEFRGLPPAARDELKANLGDRIAVQESDWECGSFVEANHKRKPCAGRPLMVGGRGDVGGRPVRPRGREAGPHLEPQM
jgi:hypothetical protein